MNILNLKNKYTFTLSENLKALFDIVSQVNSNILVGNSIQKILTLFTATLLTENKTFSTENHLVFWLD